MAMTKAASVTVDSVLALQEKKEDGERSTERGRGNVPTVLRIVSHRFSSTSVLRLLSNTKFFESISCNVPHTRQHHQRIKEVEGGECTSISKSSFLNSDLASFFRLSNSI